MRMAGVVVYVMATTLLVARASPHDSVNLLRRDQIDKSAKKVKELQKERIATLKMAEDLVAEQYKMAAGSIEEV
jgi:hypothetical protein